MTDSAGAYRPLGDPPKIHGTGLSFTAPGRFDVECGRCRDVLLPQVTRLDSWQCWDDLTVLNDGEVEHWCPPSHDPGAYYLRVPNPPMGASTHQPTRPEKRRVP